MIVHLRSKLVVKLSGIILAILVLLSGALMYVQLENTKKASQEAIGSFSMHVGQSYAAQFDVSSYADFLKEPKETDTYWRIRETLDRFRQQLGALYVYTVKIDDQDQPLIQIDGQPKGSEAASPIGEGTDMPKEVIEQLLQGKTVKTGLVHDPEYGDYISSYSPIRDASGAIIGALGIDTDVTVASSIYRDVVKSSTGLLALTGGLALLVFLMIVWFMYRALRPLGTVVKSAEAIARGDLAEAKRQLAGHRISASAADEIGQAYAAMHLMTERLGVTLGDVVRDMAGSATVLVESTDQFAVDTDQLVRLNVQLERSIAELAEGSEHQRIGAADSARALEEITFAIQRVSHASASVSSASNEALDTAALGNRSIRELRQQVGHLAEAAELTADSVKVLSRYMEEIEPVLQTITTVADQTKLLALNASIEAARAGEHGSGFAVVAGEIRKLADASGASASQISTLLQLIREEAARIDGRMTESGSEVWKSRSLSEQMEGLYQQVIGGFVQVNEQIQEVSAAAQEILAGSEETAASVEEIAQISQAAAHNTAAILDMAVDQLEAARRIAATTEQLKASSAGLEDAVKRFNL